MDVIEPMVCGRECNESRRCSERGEPITLGKSAHERIHHWARWWDKSPYRDILIGRAPKRPWDHAVRSIAASNGEHFVRSAMIERPMELQNEIARSGLREFARGCAAIDVGLNTNVRYRLDL